MILESSHDVRASSIDVLVRTDNEGTRCTTCNEPKKRRSFMRFIAVKGRTQLVCRACYKK